jgi:enamine deaminase RidA (YjgF/YER057c/UK114 family)
VSKDVTAKIDKATKASTGTSGTSTGPRSNRRGFLAKAGVAAAAAVAATAPTVRLRAAEAEAAPASGADDKPTKKVFWSGGKRPEKQALFSPAVAYGNLLFLSGIGAHFEGDIKAHTKHVLDEIKKKLEECGSSMDKVLKVNVYLNDLKDYAAMNEVFLGSFGPDPGVRTTVAPAGGIPGNSLVEIDVIAYI